jgi:hypothetical protein
VEEGFGQANLHLHLDGVFALNPLCCSIEVGVHDLDVILNQKNVTYEGKAPEVVSGLGHGADGPPMRAKVRVQQATHQLIRPMGGWQGNNNNLLLGGAVSSGLLATGLCLI